MISFNDRFTAFPALFPIEVPVITAFWTTPSSEQVQSTASRETAIIDTNNGAGMIDHIEEYLGSKNIKLDVTLVIAARWNNTIIMPISEVYA